MFKEEDIPLNDPAVFDMIGEGLNLGIFQLDSDLSCTWSKRLKPRTIEEISELTSLVRPGCLDSELTQLYKEIKVDGRPISYMHPDLEPILQNTQGVLIYQEQVMKIAATIAGFDLKEADHLRKAVGKKLPEEMAKLKDKFIDGTVAKGYDRELGIKLFEYIEKFADYGFNKCLSPENRVERIDGKIVELAEIKIGDKIKAYDYEKGAVFYDEVIDIIDSGLQTLYKIGFSNGEFVVCTTDHKFLTTDNKMDAINSIFMHNKKVLGYDYKYNLVECEIVAISKAGFKKCIDLEMQSAGHNFICEKMIVSNSHANCYSQQGYITAYLKAHYPIEFYTAMLRYADKAIDTDKEVTDIVNDARLRGITVTLPNLSKCNIEFEIEDNKIVFGLGHIKGIGEAAYPSIFALSEAKTFEEFIKVAIQVGANKRTVEALIGSGAVDKFGSRVKCREYYNLVSELSKKELKLLVESINDEPNVGLMSHIEGHVFEKSMKNRKPKLSEMIEKFKASNLKDSFRSILASEKQYLGVSLSGSESELYDNTRVNCSCIEVLTRGPGERFNLGVIIVEATEKLIKRGKSKGKKMMFLRVEDFSYLLKGVMIFDEAYEEAKPLLYEGSAVLLSCCLSKDRAVIVEGVEEL